MQNMQDIADFVQGPLVSISFILFVLGIAFQSIIFVSLSRSVKRPLSSAPTPFLDLSQTISKRTVRYLWERLKASVLIGRNPIMFSVSLLFHLLFFIIPIFLMGHNVLLDLSWGVSFGSLPEQFSDVLTLVFIACCVFFLARRLFLARVRAMTSFGDYVILVLAAAPFVTGFMAYHQLVDYNLIITLHILSGELLLILAPFTKLVHMVFAASRFIIVHENTYGSGVRTW